MADAGKVETRFDRVTKGKLARAGGTFNPVLDSFIRGAIVARVNADMKRLGFGDQFQILPRRTRRGRKG